MTALEQHVPAAVKKRLRRTLRRVPGAPALAAAWERYCTTTSGLRMKPSFFVIGAQRAGTSSFYWNLVRHPNVVPASLKEVHFFDDDDNYRKGASWYGGHFPLRLGRAGLGRTSITGEATPAYLWRPRVPARVAALLPDARFIALLRDPVDRAYSNFQMSRRAGREGARFEEAIRRELDHLGGRRITAATLEDCAAMPYLQRGVYVEQLRHWLRVFDRSRFEILDSRDFYANPLATLRRTATGFLGLPEWTPSRYWKHDKEAVKYPPLDPALRARLKDFFRPYNEDLFDLLHWSRRWE